MSATQSDTISTKELCSRAGIPRGSLAWFASRADVRPAYEVKNGRVFAKWRPESVEAIRKLRRRLVPK